MYTRTITITVPSTQVVAKRYQPKHLAEKPRRRKTRRNTDMQTLNRTVSTALIIAIVLSFAVCISAMTGINRPTSSSTDNTALAATDKDLTPYVKIDHDKQRPAVEVVLHTETTLPAETWLTMELPSHNTGQKTFMDYKAITSTSSLQYALQQDAYTDNLGLRRYGDMYMIALGTYYGNVGDRFKITFESGCSILAIMGDVKANQHTDEKHQHRNGNIVEFIIDGDALSDEVWYHGDVSYADPMFKGKVTNIQKLTENSNI